MNITQIIEASREKRASDIHIVCGLPVRIRVDGELVNFDEMVLSHEDCEAYARELLGEGYKEIGKIGETDFATTFTDGIRCRINVYRQQRSVSAAIRILSSKIPELENLGLPPVVPGFADFSRGIVIVTGETGSGKSTTLAALIDRINHTRRQHIITLEDPIEYIYTPDRCTVNQREIGVDTRSYETGLKAVLREDPDIILIGEMRSLDTIETALQAAETGHLVFATLHTNSAPNTIDRIVNVFPGEKQQQIRLQLSMTLQAVIAQQLLPRRNGGGRALACEVMKTNSAIRNLIREAKTPQIANALATSGAEGNITMDNSLAALVNKGVISAETAVSAAHDTDYVRGALGIRPNYKNDRMMIR